MPLKTLVKVSNVTNLSDARYCAGMGAEMLGFAVVEGEKSYVAPKLFQEIRGWVSVPKIVAQLQGADVPADLAPIIAHYVPDYFEVSSEQYKRNKNRIDFPLIVHVTGNDFHLLGEKHPNVSYWIVDEQDAPSLNENIMTNPILCRISSPQSLATILSLAAVKGIVLSGSQEVRPGFKDYDNLADVLEMLEE